MTKEYRICIIEGKPRKVIVENRKITNRNPSKDELKGLGKESYIKYKDRRDEPRPFDPKYSDEELLIYLVQYYVENGKVPTVRDFYSNSEYPGKSVYIKRFGNWSNALKLVGLDDDAMINKGVLDTENQKGRLAELIILGHFKNNPIDLSGKNRMSPYDGICPNGMNYDVKSSKLCEGIYWRFHIRNICKEEIVIYYLVGMNEDWTKVEHIWRITGDMVSGDEFYIGMYSRFGIINMKKYDIIDNVEIRNVLRKYGLS